jgi:hypothetical protein
VGIFGQAHLLVFYALKLMDIPDIRIVEHEGCTGSIFSLK